MECKAASSEKKETTETGINRNIVECKGSWSDILYQSDLVLIETLWNVKSVMKIMNAGTSLVLIETLWNVKKV